MIGASTRVSVVAARFWLVKKPDSMSKRRSQASIAPSNSAVVVIAGGTEFRTSRETLEQGGRGYLAARLQYEDMMEADFGRGQQLPFIEVDRDADLFRIVLSWMRSHRLPSATLGDMHILEDLEAEAIFFALDELRAAVNDALAPLRLHTLPLRAFSVTTGTIMIGSSGDEIFQSVVLAPHEYCLITHVTATTLSFNRPRKHHKVLCFLEERDDASNDWKPIVEEVHGFSFELQGRPDGRKKAEAYHASGIIIASFVYKHIGRDDDGDVADETTDAICAPQYSQRLSTILGPRGVHNPESTPADSDGSRDTRLKFGDDKYAMETGATWTISGVIGPAAKVLEYARGSAS